MEEKIESGTIMISVRLNKEVKSDAEALFSELGMNMTTAINVFLRRCLMENKIPFEVGLQRSDAEGHAAIQKLLGMFKGDPELTVDKFLEYKRAEKELER